MYYAALVMASYVKRSKQASCPKIGKGCQSSTDCEAGEKCFGDLDNAPDKKSYCCNMVCPITQLTTFYSDNGEVYSHKENTELDKELFYTIDGMSCPFPYSYTTSYLGRHLPIGFSETGTGSVKACTTNSDCEEGSYCGESVNPSFARSDFSKEQKLRTKDASDNNKPRQYCYRNPSVGEQFMIPRNPLTSGIAVCNIDTECKTENTFCLHLPQPLFRNGATIKGVCVHVIYAISNNQEKSIALATKEGNQCTKDEDCNGLKDDIYSSKCETFERPALPGDANSNKLMLCMFAPRTCKYGTARIPKEQCSTSADCNKGIIPWTSWCDDEGFCCQDTTGKIEYLCPDRRTLALNEPECKDSCKNGVCINGHCCPGLKYNEKDKKSILSKSPYTTNMRCDPTKPLPAHTRFAYCDTAGFIVVIGTHDAFGDPFERGVAKQCSIHADCDGTGHELCIREGSKETGCYRDPYKQKPKPNESEGPSTIWTTETQVGLVVAGCVFAGSGIGIFFWRRKMVYKYNDTIITICKEIIMTDKDRHLSGQLPPLSYQNCLDVVKMGSKNYAAFHNIELYKVECYAFHANNYVMYLEIALEERKEIDHIARLTRKGQHISREYNFPESDEKKGNTPRVDVNLEQLTRDRRMDICLGTEDMDSLQLDSSTIESTKSVKSLAVDKTQSDHSVRRNAAGGDIEAQLQKEEMEANDELIETVLDIIVTEEERFIEARRIVVEFVKENRRMKSLCYRIASPIASSLKRMYCTIMEKEMEEGIDADYLFNIRQLEEIGAQARGEQTEESTGDHYSQVICEKFETWRTVITDNKWARRVSMPFIGLHYFLSGKGRDDRLKSVFSELSDRYDAGRDNGRARIVQSMHDAMPTFKKNSKGITHDEQVTILRKLLKHEKYGKESEHIYCQIILTYFGKIEKEKREYSSLMKALDVVNEALEIHQKSVKLFNKKRIILATLLTVEYEKRRIQELRETLSKLIEIAECEQYYYERAQLSYARVNLSGLERGLIFASRCKQDIEQTRKDLLEAVKLDPLSIRSWLLLGKLELKHGNKETAVKHLKQAAQIEPRLNREQALKEEARDILVKMGHYQA